MAGELIPYLANGFLLVIPVLIWNACLTKQLPWGYSAEGPWSRVPGWLSALENALRAVVLIAPLFMSLRVSSHWQRAGVGVYGAGVVAYAASWLAQIWAPGSPWSRSKLGFLAPAYTAGIWLVGIGMIGERLVREWPYERSIYLAAVAAFAIVHTGHAWRAYELAQEERAGRPSTPK